MSIEWDKAKGARNKEPMVYIYKSGCIQVNRRALLMIRENNGDMLYAVLGYDSERKCVALKPVKEKTVNSFSSHVGTISCSGYFKKYNLIPKSTIRCTLIPEKDYYIFYPKTKPE
jgi:hypothetical protein